MIRALTCAIILYHAAQNVARSKSFFNMIVSLHKACGSECAFFHSLTFSAFNGIPSQSGGRCVSV